MEQQLDIVLEALVKNTSIRYLSETNQIVDSRRDEIHIQKYKLIDCPNQAQILNALQKRIGRSDTLKSRKYTLGICVLLLLSKGYSVTSLTLTGIDDSFIERCWECIQVVSQNIPIELSKWIQSAMDTRSSSGYSALFCQSRPLLSSVNLLKDSVSGNGKFLNLNAQDFGTPGVLWHRSDAIRQTMILHMKLQNAELS
jgi:hypothetical protein